MWSLSPGMHHLNHGSFGAVPVEVQARQSEWRSRWEANTTSFVAKELTPAVEVAREALAEFVGADAAGLVFVRNASQGVASVVRSLEPELQPDDEIVTTSHDYNAVRQTLQYSAAKRDASVRVVDVPFPIEEPSQVVAAVLEQVTARTKLVVIDHVTSSTGLIFPISEIVAALEPDIPVLIDGAHGPGQVPLRLEELGASWYTGNLHKWVCSPKGAAFLHTRQDRREMTVPTVISHAWNAPMAEGSSRYQGLFDWTGTDDMSPWLVVPESIGAVGAAHPGGWPGVMSRNHDLVVEARGLLADILDVEEPAPEEMIGSMAALPLPDGTGQDPGGLLSPLNSELLDRGLEALVMIWPSWPGQILRVSAHLYNEIGEYRKLGETLSDLAG